ncbi:hypothetical protein [Arthrobacter sp. 260]|uniref:hypothetical protein n=1 Tax=Arthrobacter sp. 260 TaxID=2735314 RepID=UPI0014930246|nr:hypothetical protein [Arthrobacter sp. 260]NOJ61012.1 hypothetical protein [Arthrobacter sp. 260]
MSFRYPTGWTVTESEEGSPWSLFDQEGQRILTLLSSPLETNSGGMGPLISMTPLGPIVGATDNGGTAPQAVVGVSLGHDPRAGNAAVTYGAAVPGTDTWNFRFSWGNHYWLSFLGSRELGPKDQLNELTADAEQFAASAEFRNQILPIIQSLTASEPPTSIATQAPEANTNGSCMGAKYTYQNLAGITCDEAKSILQTVLDTGTAWGARSHVTDGFDCYESSYGERIEGSPHMMCWALTGEGARDYIVLEANYR